MKNNQHPDTLTALETRLAQARADGNTTEEIIVLYALGEAYFQGGAFQQALILFMQGLELALKHQKMHHLNFLYGAVGRVYYTLENTTEARKAFEQALAIAARLEQPASSGVWHLNLAMIDLRERVYEKAYEQAGYACQIGEALQDPLLQINALKQQALALLHQGQIQPAAEHIAQALDLRKEMWADFEADLAEHTQDEITQELEKHTRIVEDLMDVLSGLRGSGE